MTQSTTKNDKQEQCDRKHNALKKINEKNFTPYPVPPAHAPVSVDLLGPYRNFSYFCTMLRTQILLQRWISQAIFGVNGYFKDGNTHYIEN